MRGNTSLWALIAACVLAGAQGCWEDREPPVRTACCARSAGHEHAAAMALTLQINGEIDTARRVLAVALAQNAADREMYLRYAISWLPEHPDTTHELLEDIIAADLVKLGPSAPDRTAIAVMQVLSGTASADKALDAVRRALELGPGAALSVIAHVGRLDPQLDLEKARVSASEKAETSIRRYAERRAGI